MKHKRLTRPGESLEHYQERKNRKKRNLIACLKCDTLFESKGPWHRLCDSCKGENIRLCSSQLGALGTYLGGDGIYCG